MAVKSKKSSKTSTKVSKSSVKLPSGITEKMIRNAAEDLNETLGLDPGIKKPDSSPIKYLIESIKVEAANVEDEDALTSETWKVLDAFEVGPHAVDDDEEELDDEDSEEEEDEEEEDEEEDDEEEEDLEEEDDEEEEEEDEDSEEEEDEEEEDDNEEEDLEEEDDEDDEPSLSDTLEEMDRTELKAYIKNNELDITVKKSMSDDDIREAILSLLDEESEENEEEEEKPKMKKKTATKEEPKKKVAAGKTTKAKAKKEEPVKKGKTAPKKAEKKGKNVSEEKKLGVIATITESLKKKALTEEEIHEILVEKFPERNPDSMRNTIKANVRGKIYPEKLRDKGFELVKIKGGKYKVKKSE